MFGILYLVFEVAIFAIEIAIYLIINLGIVIYNIIIVIIALIVEKKGGDSSKYKKVKFKKPKFKKGKKEKEVTEADPEWELYQRFGNAVVNGDVRTAEKCISDGIDVNRPISLMRNGEMQTNPVIFDAIYNNDIVMVKLLFNSGQKKDALWTSLDESDTEPGDPFRSEKYTIAGYCLEFCCFGATTSEEQNKGIQMMQILLENGVNPEISIIYNDNYRDVLLTLSALIIAFSNPLAGSVYDYNYAFKLFDLLLNYGVNVNAKSENPVSGAETPILFIAIEHEDSKFVKKLLDAGASWNETVDRDGVTYKLKNYPFDRMIFDNSSFLNMLRLYGWQG